MQFGFYGKLQNFFVLLNVLMAVSKRFVEEFRIGQECDWRIQIEKEPQRTQARDVSQMRIYRSGEVFS